MRCRERTVPRADRDGEGGTQDNGTFQWVNPDIWPQTMWGDGGQSGFDVATPSFRFHTYFNATPEVNFSDGAIPDWNWIADPIFGIEPQGFYIPIISDPVVSKSLYPVLPMSGAPRRTASVS